MKSSLHKVVAKNVIPFMADEEKEKIDRMRKGSATGEKRSLKIALAIVEGTRKASVIGHGYSREFKASKVQYITIDLD